MLRCNRIIISLLFVFCLLLVHANAAAQETITCRADKIEYFQNGKEVIANGNVIITYKDIKLTCNELSADMEIKDICAHGNVVLTEGNNKLTGENLIYNLDSKKGSLDNAFLFSPIWYGKGDKIKKISKNEFEIDKGYITTCDPDKPHCANYRISSQKIDIILEDRVRAKNVIFWIGKVPFFYFPFYSYSLKNNRPHVRVSFGHKKEWGTFIKNASRFNIKGGEGHFNLDYYERKGIGLGIDYKYTTIFGEGELDTYYIYERDRLKEQGVPAEKERHKVELKHHYKIDKDADFRLEYHRLSDTDFIKDYFYSDYEQEAQPESYLLLTYSPENYIFSAKVKKRTNRFFTVVQQLPELKFEFSDTPLGKSNFYLQKKISFNNFYRKYANHSADDEKTYRLDTYNQLSYQIASLWNWLNVRPYLGTRQTYYNKDKNGKGDLLRGVYYGGVDLSTRFSKIYDFKSSFLGVEINRLKHIIKSKASYNYIREPNLSSSRLYQFDNVDSISNQNAITLTLENVLQTKRKVRKFTKNEDLGKVYPLYNVVEEEKRGVINLINLIIATDCYMHTEGHRISDIIGELDLNLYDWLNINVNTAYDSYARGVTFNKRFKTVNTDLTAKGKKWDLILGNRYQQSESCELTGEFNYVLNSLWKIGIYERYDFVKQKNWDSGGYSAVHGYRIVHELPCWIVEFNYDFKRLDTTRKQNNSTVWLIFRIKALPETAAEISKT